MPGMGRVVAPNMPHHVVQRGHNRNAVFVDDGYYSYYLDSLGTWTQQPQVKVYALGISKYNCQCLLWRKQTLRFCHPGAINGS
jgi:putative transposase